MIPTIEIKLIDRNTDLFFYDSITPICVKIVDFTRNQQRRIESTFTIDGSVDYKLSTGAYTIGDYTIPNRTIGYITQSNKTIEQLSFRNN